MSYNVKEILLDTFRGSLKTFIMITLLFIGTAFLDESYEKGIYLLGLVLIASIVLVISYFERIFSFIRGQIEGYKTFTAFAPKVIEIDKVLAELKGTKRVEDSEQELAALREELAKIKPLEVL